MKRRCNKCGEKLGVDVDVCPVCGASNPIPVPWYAWPVGAAIVAVLFYFLVDLDDVRKILDF